jgi:hypothetical protein
VVPGRRNSNSTPAQSPVRCMLFNMKFFLLFVFQYFIPSKSFSQEVGYFKSQYQLVIAGDSFNLEHYAKVNGHGEWPDQSKFKLRTNSFVKDSFCLIDSILLINLDSIMTSEIQVFKDGLKLPVYKITLTIIEPDGNQLSLTSKKNHIARHKRVKYLAQLSPKSKLILRTVWFHEGEKERMIVSNTGWIIR